MHVCAAVVWLFINNSFFSWSTKLTSTSSLFPFSCVYDYILVEIKKMMWGEGWRRRRSSSNWWWKITNYMKLQCVECMKERQTVEWVSARERKRLRNVGLVSNKYIKFWSCRDRFKKFLLHFFIFINISLFELNRILLLIFFMNARREISLKIVSLSISFHFLK